MNVGFTQTSETTIKNNFLKVVFKKASNSFAFQSLPLYLYSDNSAQQTIEQTIVRTPNLNPTIVKKIVDKLDLPFINEKEKTEATFAPIDLLDYIYVVLHSPTYREK